jgi:N-acetylglucosaminyldiphosphoundecaprenol N-acetyl-beta-D-mannosaminyltransferase
VALGTPQKEIWIDEHAKQLKPQLIMGVGGSFDVIAGVKRRAPQWMQTIGMEWLWRLALEPRRMAKRYLIGNTVFVKVIIKDIFHHWRVHYQIKGYE